MINALSEDFRAGYQRDDVFLRFRKVFDEPDTGSLWNRMTYFDMAASLPTLLQVEDRVSMAVSLESRVPLLDPDVMDFVASVPPRIKWKDGEMKYLFRQAVKDWLPRSVFERQDKMGFPVPLHLWMKRETGDFIRDILFSPTCRARGIFDPDAIEELVSNEPPYGRGLWGLLQIELWHRNFIDCSHHLDLGEQHAVIV